jgi:mitochondrial fission protein ELM1
MSLPDLTWVLTTGEAGMRSQALGLAEAVGLPIQEKRIVVGRPWTWLPGGLLPFPLRALDPCGDMLAPPWPRLVIGCGRRSIGAALAVKRASKGRALAVYIQNPECGRRRFDLVAALPHDLVHGPNVVQLATALHGVTNAYLAQAREKWRGRLVRDSALHLGVLVGGDNGSYRLTSTVTRQLIRILSTAHGKHGMHALLTPSRRTPTTSRGMLADALASGNLGWMWDETGDNPYLGILALADRLIVTGDSVSMISEALASGRPVHVLPLEGRGKRHDAFLRRIADAGMVSLIAGEDLDWTFEGRTPINSTVEPAARIRMMLEARLR